MTLARRIGRELAAVRERRGVGLHEMKRQLGWRSKAALLAIERGEANPTLKRLEEVAATYGGHLKVEFVPGPEPDDDL